MKLHHEIDQINICIISPSLLETGTNRGGGCEVTDFNVGLVLSQFMNVAILSPYYKKYLHTIRVNDHFVIKELPVQAFKKYPPATTIKSFYSLVLMYFCSIITTIKILRLIRKNLKIIIIHNPQTSLIPSIIAKLWGIKIVYSEGNTTPWTDPYINCVKKTPFQSIFYHLDIIQSKFLCTLADRIRAQSVSIKSGMICKGVDPNKIEVISAGISKDEFKPLTMRTVCPDSVHVGFIGRLTDIKGASLLLEIVQNSQTTLPHVKYSLFGEGPYKEQFLKLSNIEHIGFVPRNELNEYLSKIDLVLSFQKELGRAEIESMAAGKVIIVPDIGEMNYFIHHMQNGFLCQPSAESYIDSIRYLIANPLALNLISLGARKTTIDLFSWESVGNRWIELLNKTGC